MPVVSEKYGLAYYSVPKVACTSIKQAFYYMETGTWLNDRSSASGGSRNIHDQVPGETPFDRAEWQRSAHLETFTVIRDPIKRFLSAYANRVLHHGELDRWRIRNGSLSLRHAPRPSLETFIEHLEDYQADSTSIRHHTLPISHFLGHDLGAFKHVFKIEDLADVEAFLRRHTGLDLTLPHSQAGGPKLAPERLSGTHLLKLRDYYARDYELLSGYYA